LLCAAALALRFYARYAAPNIFWPDEFFQVTEPAHRLLFGTGIVTWEWVLGLRSWLFPGLALGLMALGRQFGSNPAIIQFPLVLFMALASCLPVICGYGWGRHVAGRMGGLVVGAINVVWVDLVYFSTHTFSDVIAGDCLVACLYLGYPGWRVLSPRRLFAFGVLAGLTFDLRFQLGPALAVAVIWACGGPGWPRAWRPVLTGVALPVLALGALDWATLGVPWQSIYLNVWFNLVEGVGGHWGEAPIYAYVALLIVLWSGAVLPVAFGAALGAWRLPLVGWVSVIVFGTFSLIPHKEFRFIYPALPLVMSLVGVATARLVLRFAASSPFRPINRRSLGAIAILSWTFISVSVARTPEYQRLWTFKQQALSAFTALSDLPGLCGVGLYHTAWYWTPGNTGLPPTVELSVTSDDSFRHDADGFNAVLADAKTPPADDRFAPLQCFTSGAEDGDICIWHRAGGCVAGIASPPPINWPNGRPPP
jgi:phosphatidylinositol glycan class B